MNKVEGKVAIVTGGTQGLGKAIAINFAKGGARGIVILGRNEDRGNEVSNSITKELGCKTLFIKTELSNVEDCRQAVATTKKEFSQIDILVNAAGITDRGNIVETSEELFDKMIGVNVKGPFFLTQDVVKIMIEKEIKGSIVNIGSQAALTGQPFLASYSLSKGALATLTKNTAFALLKNNIRVNAICPVFTVTPMFDPVAMDKMKSGISEKLKATVPMKRFADVMEQVNTMLWLCSDEASFITGQAISVDGGLTA